ncbi:MAG: hypothetical protein P9M15_02075 [Candidatus Electryoneaceae bacterium]|nr:hypothetical protein [Candidatus Electryoneaceae bacterium]
MGRVIALLLGFYVGAKVVQRLLRAFSDGKKSGAEPDQDLMWQESDIEDADYKEIP